MANPEHIELLRKGKDDFNKWRKDHPNDYLMLENAELSGLDLSGTYIGLSNLNGVNLSNTNLSEAVLSNTSLMNADLSNSNLSYVDLSSAILINADLSGSNLENTVLMRTNFGNSILHDAILSEVESYGTAFINADFSRAHLKNTIFTFSNLRGTNFSEATINETEFLANDLTNADFSKARLNNISFFHNNFNHTTLSGVNFSGSKFSMNTISKCNLADCHGLGYIEHIGPSSISLDTIIGTIRKSGNRLIPDIYKFLINTGVPSEFLEVIPKMMAEDKYYTSFICYGGPNEVFAKRLVNDLMSRGVSCWIYSLDYTPGERTWREIMTRRQESEKMIILCSAESLIRDGVLKEIEEQIDETPDKIIPISLDNTWKSRGFHVLRAERDLKPFLIERNYADFSNESRYEESLRRLLIGLRRSDNT